MNLIKVLLAFVVLSYSQRFLVKANEQFIIQLLRNVNPELSVSVQLSYPISYNEIDNQEENPMLRFDLLGAISGQFQLNVANIIGENGALK